MGPLHPRALTDRGLCAAQDLRPFNSEVRGLLAEKSIVKKRRLIRPGAQRKIKSVPTTVQGFDSVSQLKEIEVVAAE